jgi:hypothetical protein
LVSTFFFAWKDFELQHFTTDKPSEFTSVSVRGTEKFHGAKHHTEHRKQQEVLQQSRII